MTDLFLPNRACRFTWHGARDPIRNLPVISRLQTTKIISCLSPTYATFKRMLESNSRNLTFKLSEHESSNMILYDWGSLCWEICRTVLYIHKAARMKSVYCTNVLNCHEVGAQRVVVSRTSCSCMYQSLGLVVSIRMLHSFFFSSDFQPSVC